MNTRNVVCKSKSYASNKRGNWNHLTIIQKIPEQQKSQNQRTRENGHIAHCTHIIRKMLTYVQVGFTLSQATKALRESRGNSSTLFLTSALEGGEGSASRPGQVLTYKYKIFSMGSNITCNMNCSYRIAATQCNLKTWFNKT